MSCRECLEPPHGNCLLNLEEEEEEEEEKVVEEEEMVEEME